MSVIQFDVLVPPAAAGEVKAAFQRALDILVRRQMLASDTVAMQRVRIDDSVHSPQHRIHRPGTYVPEPPQPPSIGPGRATPYETIPTSTPRS